MENSEILGILENDGRLTPEQIAVMLGREKSEIREIISRFEDNGTILGYKAMIDWDKTDREDISAMIELRVSPQREHGFDKIASKIYNYPEVKSLCLMSGGYDLSVVIEGRTMKEVALFVAEKLAPMECVISTATHFVLRKYKDKGVIYRSLKKDERGNTL